MDVTPGVSVERDVPARMRDGTTLYADVYRLRGEGPFPVILIRLPYDKTKAESTAYAHPSWYARRGYLVVVQDTRGRWASEGEFYPFKYEMADGFDSVEWAARLPGANGKVGMYGFSYPGATQLLAAVMQPPHLTCICPALTASQYYEGWTYNGGALSLAFAVSWALSLSVGSAHRQGLGELERELWMEMERAPRWYGYLPLAGLPLLQRANIAPFFYDWVRHFTYDEYWQATSVDLRYDRVRVPALHIGGWYDIFRDGTLKNFIGLRSGAGDAEARAGQRLLMGPWQHRAWGRFVGSVDFGPEARNLVDEVQLRWFDYWLKGLDDGLLREPPVSVFVMGANTWRHEEEWPPRQMRAVPWFLHSAGRANSLNGDGTLNPVGPGDEPPDIFVYDPRSPVPSLGGHSCCAPSIVPMGPVDQREVELQNQVLVYTGEPLTEDLTIAGPVTATLYAASSAVDTDFTVKLVDVHPEGRAINLTEGILRARFRESLERPSLLTPGEVYHFTIDVGNTCALIRRGHRLRVEVSSSNYPHWDRNTNTGNVPGTDGFGDLVVATQVVFHDAQRPSHITLPVL